MLHKIQNAFLSVTVSEKGAELQSILGADGTEYLWQGDPAYWSDRALNIFPYVARLTDDSYYMDGRLYHMAIHGIAPYRCFEIVSNEGARLVLALISDKETNAAYPRDFVLRVMYTLQERTLQITYEVENRDDRTMYFGLGGHPGLSVPLAKGKAFEDYRLRFGQSCRPERVGTTPDCYLNGRYAPFSLEGDRILRLCHELFDDDAIILKGMAREVTLETDGDPHAVTVGFPQMDYLGLWHQPKTDAPYICIEPWSSLPSTQDQIAVLEQQKDLLSLEPHGTYRNQWWMTIA